ncbi:MAG: hypothetical protein L0H55_15575 [Candidatus Nitrosocosmicus sp.]|nr:hypothetical protein [Candidatus Nitrosocosmicus sp.]
MSLLVESVLSLVLSFRESSFCSSLSVSSHSEVSPLEEPGSPLQLSLVENELPFSSVTPTSEEDLTLSPLSFWSVVLYHLAYIF